MLGLVATAATRWALLCLYHFPAAPGRSRGCHGADRPAGLAVYLQSLGAPGIRLCGAQVPSGPAPWTPMLKCSPRPSHGGSSSTSRPRPGSLSPVRHSDASPTHSHKAPCGNHGQNTFRNAGPPGRHGWHICHVPCFTGSCPSCPESALDPHMPCAPANTRAEHMSPVRQASSHIESGKLPGLLPQWLPFWDFRVSQPLSPTHMPPHPPALCVWHGPSSPLGLRGAILPYHCGSRDCSTHDQHRSTAWVPAGLPQRGPATESAVTTQGCCCYCRHNP